VFRPAIVRNFFTPIVPFFARILGMHGVLSSSSGDAEARAAKVKSLNIQWFARMVIFTTELAPIETMLEVHPRPSQHHPHHRIQLTRLHTL